jgi:hypothetical protein
MWGRIVGIVARALHELWLYLVLLIAAIALFYIAVNISPINLWVIMAAGAVFGCLVILFIMARHRPALPSTPPDTKTTLLTPTVLVNEVRAAALVSYAQIGTVTVKKERAKPELRVFESFFGEELVMDIGVRVVAGVNLKHLREEDVVVDGKSVSITLPPTKVLMVYVDDALTRVVSHRTGWFTGRDITMMDAARREAMEGMVNAAIDKDLFTKAGQQAASAVAAIARGLGFEDIRVFPRLPAIGQHFEELQDPSTIAKIIQLPFVAPREDQFDDGGQQ